MAKKNNGFAGMDYQQIMLQQAIQSMNEPVYCRYCGRDIKQPDKNSTAQDAGGYSSQWELRNHAHEKCYQQNRWRR